MLSFFEINVLFHILLLKYSLSPSSWEQERFRRRKKWQGERKKETFNKDESEKDSDSPESLPDSTETQEVAIARENLVTLMTEQKKIQKQKVMSLVTTRGQINTSENSKSSPGPIFWFILANQLVNRYLRY